MKCSPGLHLQAVLRTDLQHPGGELQDNAQILTSCVWSTDKADILSKAFPKNTQTLKIFEDCLLKQTWGADATPPPLTQSLEILHCTLMALQGRVGLRGLIQEHLQSCAHFKLMNEFIKM